LEHTARDQAQLLEGTPTQRSGTGKTFRQTSVAVKATMKAYAASFVSPVRKAEYLTEARTEGRNEKRNALQK